MALWSRNWYLGAVLFLAGLLNWSSYVQASVSLAVDVQEHLTNGSYSLCSPDSKRYPHHGRWSRV
ncbi:hypothetical protein TRAPUB_8439 [Trametes pubescens]|uniref:Uncharacterized protein n=1 Tax=Trametes pubescens TaxID=154538 RepID=A0A1M2W5A5_TRAPU|nr:hypothetical protein TRAPUB_8439 [Trametes pubescens]